MFNVVVQILGSVLLGTIFQAILVGCLTLQVWQYYDTFTDDRWNKKVLVGVVWFLCAFQLSVLVDLAWNLLILNYGHIESLIYVPWNWTVFLGVESTITFLVQAFFARRFFDLSKNWILTVIVGVLALLQWGFGLGNVGMSLYLHEFSKTQQFTWGITIWLTGAAAADIIIAAGQCWFLHKARTGFSETDGIINKLIRYSVNTGLITALIAIASLIAFLKTGLAFGHAFTAFIIAPVYACSLLANLHARATLRPAALKANEMASSHSHGVIGPGYEMRGHNEPMKFRPGSRFGQNTPSNGLNNVNITTTVYTHRELDDLDSLERERKIRNDSVDSVV